MDYEEYVGYDPQLARRVAAALLDYALFSFIFFAYVKFFGEEAEPGLYEANGIHHVLILWFLWFLYFPFMEGIWGFTPFKGLFDLKVISDRRRDFGVMVALKRHLLDPVDFFLFGLVAIILVKTTEQHKRIGDLVAHTRVVLDRSEEDVAS